MIQSNTLIHQTPQFRVLSDGQCQEIFLAALECLQRVGVLVNNPEAREILNRAGATLEGNIARIPSHIIQDSLTNAPQTFTVWGRDPRYAMHVAPDRVFFGPGPTCTYFMDPYSGERRKARLGDAALTARTCDALENVDYIMGLSLFDDVTPILSPVYEFAESIANTAKPIMAWANTQDTVADIYQIALAVAGDEASLRKKPFFALFTTYESPLRLPGESFANLFWAAEHDIPTVILGGPTVGLESPFNGASALVIHLATALASVAILQLRKPGTAIAIGGLPATMDLRTARPAYGSPEMCLYTAAASDLARFLKIPFMGTAAASESKLVDAQAGVEAALQILMSGLSGAGMVHDMGFLDCADIGSLQYLVLADEIIGMVKRIMRGIVVSPETIQLDLIEQVGPGGTYLTEPSSAARCRIETWIPSILDRDPYPRWDQRGRTDTAQRLQEKLLKILENHQPAPLPVGASEKIRFILDQAEAREKANR